MHYLVKIELKKYKKVFKKFKSFQKVAKKNTIPQINISQKILNIILNNKVDNNSNIK